MAITDALCRSFLDLWWHFDPAAATQAGIPGHDGRLGAFDPESVRQHSAALRAIAAAVEDQDVDATADEIDRTALLDHLRVLLFRFEHEQPYRRNPVLWLEHLEAACESLLARGEADDASAVSALERLNAIPGFIAAARATIRQPPGLLVETAVALLGPLTQWLEEFAERFEPQWLLQEESQGAAAAAMTEARAALEGWGAALREAKIDPDPHAAAVGEDEVDRRLHYEHASIHNAGEVWRGGLRLANEVEGELSRLARDLDPSRSWRKQYELLAEESGSWAELAEQCSGEIAAHEAVLERWDLAAPAPPLPIQPLSSAAQVLEPLARYRPASRPAEAALLLGDAPRALLPWLAARLGVPGMHLHQAQRDLLPGMVRRHIAAASTPLGWALYAGELAAELRSEDSEGKLAERVLFLRDIHLAIVDIGLHTRQLTAGEAVTRLTAHLPLDAATALALVRRLACRPTSACAAVLGWQELRRLRDEVRSRRGGEFRLADFHRELWSFGGLPVPLIRWGMGLDA